jgi:Zn-finger nucleic acid-binding protein
MGLKVNCPNCDAELEVIETDPVELDWVYDDDEDQDEDW